MKTEESFLEILRQNFSSHNSQSNCIKLFQISKHRRAGVLRTNFYWLILTNQTLLSKSFCIFWIFWDQTGFKDTLYHYFVSSLLEQALGLLIIVLLEWLISRKRFYSQSASGLTMSAKIAHCISLLNLCLFQSLFWTGICHFKFHRILVLISKITSNSHLWKE